MPTYEYQCKGCGHEFERDQRITDTPVKKCPECGAMKAKRLISRTSFVLKGSGWYNDLYSSSGGSKEEASKDDASSSETKSEGKSESKSESKDKASSKSDSKSDSTKSSKSAGSKGKKGGKSAT